MDINVEARFCLLNGSGDCGEVERSLMEKTAIQVVLLLEERLARYSDRIRLRTKVDSHSAFLLQDPPQIYAHLLA